MQIPTRHQLEWLPAAVENLATERGWSAPSNIADNGAHHLYERVHCKPTDDLWQRLADLFGPLHTVWVSRIDAGGYVVTHRDAGPYRQRWQIPIQRGGETVIDALPVDTIELSPFKVTHWRPHSIMVPDGEPARIHVVFDTTEIVNPERLPFKTWAAV